MNVVFDEDGWDDYTSWADSPKMLKRINRLIDEASRAPGFGIGKPERLSSNLSGFWSRRIDQEHRLVYTIRGDEIVIASARHHYWARRIDHFDRLAMLTSKALAPPLGQPSDLGSDTDLVSKSTVNKSGSVNAQRRPSGQRRRAAGPAVLVRG